ncbi:CRISPR system Cascade subunit CasE [Rhodobacter aestuarii]|uniref:CRISPR system Cascade subunit CasE n=1 Tax=Rhodobacter aestuarii TaxID=453582 RepID=A0A1N7Q309_9RHOB|nr:type I-E CRISPR-associated protein Cas6/Cse3/CasE [Rhodobacter aestuarii]PTV94069.1 CRISPR system Cascade subunit CasE [Rhodobacter aestuarii]SIT17238.1 CRISPR system Cascade subunit CasE [Rhodobacter aestuarii]
MSLYLSQVSLARSPSAQALAPLLMPSAEGLRRSAAHNLLWSLFADGTDRRRDFLWREEAAGKFLVLSARAPLQTDLFTQHRIKPFAPALTEGTKLEFSLRANATRMKRGGARVDVVMDALHTLPKDARAEERMALAQTEGMAWLSRQGEKAGFKLLQAQAEDYSVEVLEGHRGPRKGQPQFGILDLTGHIEITDPAAFLAQVSQGFGRAKAFGCGLMLIRRAP